MELKEWNMSSTRPRDVPQERQYRNWMPLPNPSSYRPAGPALQPRGIYMFAGASAPPLPQQTDSPSSFDGEHDYDDADVVTPMCPESRTTPSTVKEKEDRTEQTGPLTSESTQDKGCRRLSIIILYGLVGICFAISAGLLSLVLMKYPERSERSELSVLSEELKTLVLNYSEILMHVKKDLEFVKTKQKIIERTVGNNFSELQDITASICGSRNISYSYSCLSHWKILGNNCYYISKENKTWMDALWYCIQERANLVSIWTDEEQGFLRDAINNSGTYWLGVTDAEVHGNWRWKEGDLLASTTFWNIGEPKMGDDKHCGIMYPNGTWASAICTLPYRWICKKKRIC